MEQTIYRKMSLFEHEHWWFVGRRNLIEAILRSQIAGLDQDCRILDAGCGTGGNLELLSGFSRNVTGLEMEPNAAEMAAARSGKTVLVGSLPDQVPFPDESFDLIVLLDVLEHIGEDNAALDALAAKLKTGGHLLVTVPAFSFLWSDHDESHHHHRRYRLPQLTGLMRQCRLEPTYASYFNTWLFPLIALVRVVLKKLPFARNTDDLSMPSLLLNKLLTHVMTSERHLLRHGKLPFGVSIVALGRKM